MPNFFLQDAESLCAKKISHLFLQLKPVQGHPRWVSSAGSVFFAKDTLTEEEGNAQIKTLEAEKADLQAEKSDQAAKHDGDYKGIWG